MLKKRPSKKALRRVKTRITGSKQVQIHVHEFVGSTKLAEKGEDRHNHRFAGVTGKAIRVGRNHIHEIDLERTDSVDHFHELKKIRTGPAIPVGKGKHVHFVSGQTTLNDGHVHRFNFATLVQSPLTKENS